MSRSPFHWALSAAALAALCATTASARADGPGTPSQPPEQPPSQPPAQPQAQSPAQPQAQAPVVPAYARYQARQRKEKGASRWYGWQTLMCDGISVVTSPLLIGLGGYVIAPPIVHWVHGNVGRGFADLGIRIGAPIALSLLGYTAFHSSHGSDDGGAAGAIGGFLLGMVGAIVIDATVLAYQPVDEDDEEGMAVAKRRTAAAKPTFVPLIVPRLEQGGTGAVFGLAGTL
jgi:hypothetical protein